MCSVIRVFISCLVLNLVVMSEVSGQMFDKKPTVYDHMKSGANTVKKNLIDTQLKWETVFLPDECTPVDEDNFYGDRGMEIAYAKERLRIISVEEGDTVTFEYTVALDSDGTVIDTSRKPETNDEDDFDDDKDDVTNNQDQNEDCDADQTEDCNSETDSPTISPTATFTMGYGMIIPGWEMAVKGMCLGEIRRIIIPPQLAYGSKGLKEKKIPADATLDVEVELVNLKKKNIVDHYFDFIYNLHVYAFFILGLTFLLSAYYKSTLACKRRKYREIMEQKEKEE